MSFYPRSDAYLPKAVTNLIATVTLKRARSENVSSSHTLNFIQENIFLDYKGICCIPKPIVGTVEPTQDSLSDLE